MPRSSDTVFMALLRRDMAERAQAQQDAMGAAGADVANRSTDRALAREQLEGGLSERFGRVSPTMPDIQRWGDNTGRAQLGYMEMKQQSAVAAEKARQEQDRWKAMLANKSDVAETGADAKRDAAETGAASREALQSSKLEFDERQKRQQRELDQLLEGTFADKRDLALALANLRGKWAKESAAVRPAGGGGDDILKLVVRGLLANTKPGQGGILATPEREEQADRLEQLLRNIPEVQQLLQENK